MIHKWLKNAQIDCPKAAAVVQVFIIWLDKMLQSACYILEVDASAENQGKMRKLSKIK